MYNKIPPKFTGKKYNPPHGNYYPYFYKISPIHTTNQSLSFKKWYILQLHSKYRNTQLSHTRLVFNQIFKCSLNCAKVEHCLMLISKWFQLLTALQKMLNDQNQ